MAQKVLRFHVLANSDSREDQALKLKVRDQVGTLMAEKLKDADSLEESERIVKANLNLIENCAADVISAEGYAYPVSAALENCTFPEKTYGTYTFPGGVYEALRVVIGSGEGHNWWCVIFPSLCVPATADGFAEAAAAGGFSTGEIRLLTQADPAYTVKFRSLELLQALKSRLFGEE